MFGSDTAIVEEVRDEKTEKMIEYIKRLLRKLLSLTLSKSVNSRKILKSKVG